MSEPDAVPLPREGEVFFDVRGEARTMRLSWYADSAVAVFSIWHQNRCTGTFRLPFADLPRMVETLQSGPASRTPDAISRHSAAPSFPSAGPDRGYDHGETTGYLPAAAYGHQPGYETGRGYESAPHYGSEPIYGASPPYRSGPGYGTGPDYPDHPPYDHATAHGEGFASARADPAYGPPGYDALGHRDAQRPPPRGPGSQHESRPYQGYADQGGYPDSAYPDPAGYPRTAQYAEAAGYPDYRAAHQSEGGIRPAHRADTSMLDFPSAPATADFERSDWDAATASYRAP